MARVRSPNYPAFSLPDAISRVQKIHTEEQHLAAPRDVIARHLGYGGLNGASNKSISALVKYGLLEEAPGDRLRVSSRALAILYPSKPEDKADAIRAAAFAPALFGEIYGEWEGSQPSDANLRSYLIRRNFAADALDRVIQAYRETMELVTRETGAYGSGLALLEKMGAPEEHSMIPGKEVSTSAFPSSPPPMAVQGGDPYYFTFKPSVGFEGGFRLNSMADFEALIRMLNGFKTLYMKVEDIQPPSQQPDDEDQ